MITCNNCGEQLEPEWDECPYCETPVVRKLICSNCGKELKPTMRKCPYCKTPTEFGTQNPTPQGTPTNQNKVYNPFTANNSPSLWELGQGAKYQGSTSSSSQKAVMG